MTGPLVPIGRRVSKLADRHPYRAAIVAVAEDGTEEVASWREFDDRARAFAAVLRDRGVDDHSQVVVALPNVPEHLIATFAAWKLGACVVPMNPGLPARERDELLELVAPTVVIADWEGAGHVPRSAVRGAPPADEDPPNPVPRPGKAVPSGGSTGRPKIIVDPTPFAFDEDVVPWPNEYGFRRSQTQLVAAGLYHNTPFSCAVAGLAAGHTIVLLERFDAATVVDRIARHDVEFLYLAPIMMQRIARLPDLDPVALASIEAVYHTASSCPEWVKRVWIELVGAERIYESYGATEEIGHTAIRGDEWLDHPGSVGRPDGCDVRIVGPDGGDLPPGEIGEILMRPHGSAPTYRYIGAKQLEVSPDGYASVGDLGWLDEDGYLYIADRRADLIVTGGVNVYPSEVEAALTEHPDVEDVAVVGVEDDEWGRRVHAVVRAAHPTQPPSVQALDQFVRERLESLKAPKSYEFVSELPRNSAGKIRRSGLKVNDE